MPIINRKNTKSKYCKLEDHMSMPPTKDESMTIDTLADVGDVGVLLVPAHDNLNMGQPYLVHVQDLLIDTPICC